MANKIKVISGILSQITNDTSTFHGINTGIDVGQDEGYAIKRIELNFLVSQILNWPVAADAFIECNVSRTLNAGSLVMDIDDKDVVCFHTFGQKGAAGASKFVPSQNFVWDPISDLVVVSPMLYIGLDSQATAQTNSVSWKVYYNKVALSATEKLQLQMGA